MTICQMKIKFRTLSTMGLSMAKDLKTSSALEISGTFPYKNPTRASTSYGLKSGKKRTIFCSWLIASDRSTSLRNGEWQARSALWTGKTLPAPHLISKMRSKVNVCNFITGIFFYLNLAYCQDQSHCHCS